MTFDFWEEPIEIQSCMHSVKKEREVQAEAVSF